MPMTALDYPILPQFLCAVDKHTGMPAIPPAAQDGITLQHEENEQTPKKLPKGVVLGPDGKPCRSCTSFAAWRQLTKKQSVNPSTADQAAAPALAAAPLGPPEDCPPDVERLGRASWTLLHTIAAQYPESPTAQQQNDVRQFISSFSRLYPCYWCADDFQSWMRESSNAPRVSSRAEFGHWLCEAHNAVNIKLGKSTFDCSKWEERWRTGWKDGRCD